MIIWLASYPKSGNTWVRSIVSALAYSSDGNFKMNMLSQIQQFPRISHFKNINENLEDINIIKKYWIKAQEKINADKKLYFYKTHHANIKIDDYSFTNRNNTIGTIYIVRDPRNIISSLSNHFNLSQNNAKDFIFSKKALRENTNQDKSILTVLGTWEEHYNSWTQFNDSLLLIRYEDLIKDINKEILRISNYIKKFTNINLTDEKVKNIIKSTSFESLEKMEQNGNFNEYKDKSREFKFFNKGPENKWEDYLDGEIKKEIEVKYSGLMKKLGYL